MKTTRTAVFGGAGAITIGSVELAPRPPQLARLRVDLCALCGSDKRLLDSGAKVTPGHEIAATVLEVPPNAGIEVGQRVLVYIPLYCGRCDACEAGQTNRCSDLSGLVGWQTAGGFQEIIDVPPANLIPIPDDIDSAVAVLALDTVGTALHGLHLCARALQGFPSRAAVIGCGPLGLGSVASLLALGVAAVHATDVSATRAEQARLLGAHRLPDPPPTRSFPLVVEASGAAAARGLALDLVQAGGAVLLLGESNEPLEMPATPTWRRTDAFYIRSFYFPLTQVADNFALLRRFGRQLADRLCTTHPIGDLQSVFERFRAGELIKPVIESSPEKGSP